MMRYEITCTKEEKEKFERLQGQYRRGKCFLIWVLILISFMCSMALIGIIQTSDLLLIPIYWPAYVLTLIGLSVFCKDFSAYKKVERALLEKAEWRELET